MTASTYLKVFLRPWKWPNRPSVSIWSVPLLAIVPTGPVKADSVPLGSASRGLALVVLSTFHSLCGFYSLSHWDGCFVHLTQYCCLCFTFPEGF